MLYFYLSEYHRKAPILTIDSVINVSSRLRWSSDGTQKSESTGLGGNDSNHLPVTMKYCCIIELRSTNLFSALRCFIISLFM